MIRQALLACVLLLGVIPPVAADGLSLHMDSQFKEVQPVPIQPMPGPIAGTLLEAFIAIATGPQPGVNYPAGMLQKISPTIKSTWYGWFSDPARAHDPNWTVYYDFYPQSFPATLCGQANEVYPNTGYIRQSDHRVMVDINSPRQRGSLTLMEAIHWALYFSYQSGCQATIVYSGTL